MNKFKGKDLFPEIKQVTRIQETTQSILDEVSFAIGEKITYMKFCEIINKALLENGYSKDCLFNTSLINRLVKFGDDSTGANSLKILESFPLLHVVTKQYSVQDLKRIALGQKITEDNSVLVTENELNNIKDKLLSVLNEVDSLKQDNSSVFIYDPDIPEEQKFGIFASILNYKNNLDDLLDQGILTIEQIEESNKTEIVSDEIMIFVLANCEIPPNVSMYFTNKSIGRSHESQL